ncbi:transposase [Streptomyces sp. NPDC093510]|uniref:transposase n=1 Tax=Streptomyces sp. NPDC093510 TaxID=3155199 RepID=UPI003444ED16
MTHRAGDRRQHPGLCRRRTSPQPPRCRPPRPPQRLGRQRLPRVPRRPRCPPRASTSKSSAEPPAARASRSCPRRWVAERTLGWLMHHRRLARDYEALPTRSTAMIYIAMIALMACRITAESTPTW